MISIVPQQSSDKPFKGEAHGGNNFRIKHDGKIISTHPDQMGAVTNALKYIETFHNMKGSGSPSFNVANTAANIETTKMGKPIIKSEKPKRTLRDCKRLNKDQMSAIATPPIRGGVGGIDAPAGQFQANLQQGAANLQAKLGSMFKSEQYFRSLKKNSETDNLINTGNRIAFGINPEHRTKAKNKLQRKQKFYELLHQVDSMDEKLNLDNPLDKADRDIRTIPNMKEQTGKSKADYWQHQASKRADMYNAFQKTKPQLEAAVKTKKDQAEIDKRNRFHSMMHRSSQRVVDALKSNNDPHIHLGTQNDKLKDTAHFSTMLGVTCPLAGSCLHSCFGITSGLTRMPSVENHVINNTAATAKENFADRMIDKLHSFKKEHPSINKIRIHAIGDMYNQDYLNDWNKVIKAHPDLKFYAYTKSSNLNWNDINQNPNFALTHSTDGILSKLANGRRAVIAPNQHAFDALMQSGLYEAAHNEDNAASEKGDKHILLRYHGAGKAGWHRNMLNDHDRAIINQNLAHMPEADRYMPQVYQKNVAQGKTKPKVKKDLHAQIEKLRSHLKALEAKAEKKKAA
jgi:hypothetical protein